MKRTPGVDFDRRCNKYRVRLTRKGMVFHLGYFKSKSAAIRKRKLEEDNYNNGIEIDYIHCYSTSSGISKIEGDVALYSLGLSPEAYIASPQRSLLVAVLIQAIKDRIQGDDAILRGSANHWFESKARDGAGFTFLDVCEELVLDPLNVMNVIQAAEKDKKSSRRLTGRRLVRKQGG
jgi:hypothetical protein